MAGDDGVFPDITKDTYAAKSCSIPEYLGAKLYEYVAAVKFIYELAASPELREEFAKALQRGVVGTLGKSMGSHAQASTFQNAAMMERMLSHFGLGSKERADQHEANAMKHFGEEAKYSKELDDKLKKIFENIKKELDRRWNECGTLYTFVTVGADLSFLVAELAIGNGLMAAAKELLRGLRIVTSLADASGAVISASRVGAKVTKDTLVRVAVVVVNPAIAVSNIKDAAPRIYRAGDLDAEFHVEKKLDHSGTLIKDPQPPAKPKRLSPEEYEKLRGKTPSQKIRDAVNKGQPAATPANPVPDEWLPGLQRTGRLEADHIVSMKEISEMPGFANLSSADQLAILNSDYNFVGLSKAANTSKGANSFSDWFLHKKSGTPVNEELRQRYMAIEEQNQKRLKDDIKKRLEEANKNRQIPFRDDEN